MKLTIDRRPSKEGQSDPFFAIRLRPETNEDMQAIEWDLAWGFKPSGEIVKSVVGDFHYVITFQLDRKEGE